MRLAGTLDDLVDRAPTVRALLYHRLGVVAAHRRRALSRPVEAPLQEEERFAAQASLAAPIILERVREIAGQPVTVLKGPEVAAHYPDPRLRPHHDLDVLVPDAAAAQRALLAAGCEVRIEQPSPHHELPLVFPDLPLVLELHSAPLAPRWARVGGAEVLACAGDSAWQPGRALAPPPEVHAVLIAAHAWVERPLRRVLDLVDVLVLLGSGDRAAADETAERWNLGRLWRTTVTAAEHLLERGEITMPLRTWARNTPAARERTRGESMLEYAVSPFSALPARQAVRVSARSLAHAIGPRPGEPLAARLHPRASRHPSLDAGD